MNFKDSLYKRFCKYVTIDTQSDENSATFPSTKKQLAFAAILASELKKIGVKKVSMDKYGYVTGEIPANEKTRETVLGFLAHMDTSPALSGANVKPQLHKKYKGGKIEINKKLSVELNAKNSPELAHCIGHDIVTASGDTLLGADDKAGIAIIMTGAEHLIAHPEIKHGTIKIGFTPDEEIGKGVNHFDVKKFGAHIAYTFDGDTEGVVEDETFNADGLKISVIGKSSHTGTAKGAMANATTIAADIISSWPENMRPESTELRDGFIYFADIKADTEKAEISGLVREHDLAKLKLLEKHLEMIVAEKKLKYPLAEIKLEFKEQYRNMKSVLLKYPEAMNRLNAAVRKAGIEPRLKAVRGGTDGARLSFMGLPTPNVFTGSANFHGRLEWVSLDTMEKAVEVMVNLVSA